MLNMSNVSFAFQPGQHVLQDISLSAQTNEFISLVGKSGSGKSTLFKLITTELHPTTGAITYQERPVQRSDVAYMPQKDLLLPWRTVWENILLPAQVTGTQSEHTACQAKQWIDQAGLSHVIDALPHQLSGGMRQRVAFIRTLMTDRPILLLDEPFGALDDFTQKDMQEWLLSIWAHTQKTILLITHNIEEAIYLSDQIYVLHPHTPTQHTQQLHNIPIELSRPRLADVRYTSEFIHYKQQLERKLHET